jgi:hypothetical protein
MTFAGRTSPAFIVREAAILFSLCLSAEWPYRISSELTFCQKVTSGDRESRAIDVVMAEDFLLAPSHSVVVRKTRDLESSRDDAFLEQQSGAGFA